MRSPFIESTLLLAAMAWMLSADSAQAMEIQQFDKMADADQDEYVAELVIGAQKVLREAGKDDLAGKVHTLFTQILSGDKVTLGMVEFERNLARARVADLERIAKDPSASRLEVEHAMLVTLKKSGIVLPKAFMHVGDGFRPKKKLQNQ